ETFLEWDAVAPGFTQKDTDAVKFVVYQFFPGEDVNLEDSQTIIAMTPEKRLLLDKEGNEGCRFVVTALDRMNRESEARSVTY
ncbi:MAG: hypothetical protein K2G29_03905, partial [Muribaculaceae bacterium]|nr:hypothetical protein [Muribaculaceae bacterium]